MPSNHDKLHPESGPRVILFSGGTAMREISRALKSHTHHSVHFVSPFDSGGSSAQLRQAFDMPAVGDLRSRLIDLADESQSGHPEVCQLLSHRLPRQEDQTRLQQRLERLVLGQDELIRQLDPELAHAISTHLGFFQAAMPETFNLQGASIGNLVLAGGYLEYGHRLQPMQTQFSDWLAVRGQAFTIVDEPLHLAAELVSGERIIGQHRLTGKETPPIKSAIRSLGLSRDRERWSPVSVRLPDDHRHLIAQAHLICYAPGSFFSSLMANLLPVGVGRSIASALCPKIYIPNLGTDPEQLDMDLELCLDRLLEYLHRDAPGTARDRDLVTAIVHDVKETVLAPAARQRIQARGIRIVSGTFVHPIQPGHYAPAAIIRCLMACARGE